MQNPDGVSHLGVVPLSMEREVARPGSMNLLYYPGSRVVVIEIYSSARRQRKEEDKMVE